LRDVNIISRRVYSPCLPEEGIRGKGYGIREEIIEEIIEVSS